MTNAVSIESLVLHELPAAQRGDRDAYGRIVAACQNTVTAVALAITRDVPASEDIAQEAFLSAWQNLRRLQNPSSFLPWLRQIARNLARDYLRSGRHRPLHGEAAEIAIELAADPDPQPMQRLLEDERERTAADLISALPEDSREALLLFYREGQSSQQVAALLGLSDAAVRKRLSRARQSVREDLLARFGEFARGSAPGMAFTAMVGAALAVSSPSASAAVAANLGAAVAGKSLAKIGAGALGGVAFGIVASVAAMYLSAHYLLRFTATDAERVAIRRFCWAQTGLSVLFVLIAIAVLQYTSGWRPITAAVLAFFVVINYQVVVWLPRIMAPCFAREAARDPIKAARDRRAFTWIYGWGGTLIGTACALGSLLYALIASGRL